jgi:hypothetical protein
LGLLDEKGAYGVFSNSAPLTVGAMFILSGALIRTGVIDKVGNYVVDRAKRHPRLAVLEVFGGGLLVSGFINSTPFVVVMMPVCFRLAEALGVSPKKLLMPLSVIAVLGGCLTLIGTSTNLVVAGGLDPFGHKKTKNQEWYSLRPLSYMRSLLCLSQGSHPHATCDQPIHFDVWSHHPYTYGGPFGRAKLRDDVELGDLPKMRAVLKAGVRLHHIVSSQPVKFWVTEFGWSSHRNTGREQPWNMGVTEQQQARFTIEALRTLRREHPYVTKAFVYNEREKQTGDVHQNGYGIMHTNLTPKPVYSALRRYLR